jgi:tetratricopeptide (TPR) repeat protein
MRHLLAALDQALEDSNAEVALDSAVALLNLGALCIEEGRVEEALTLYGDARLLVHRFGDDRFEAAILDGLGRIQLQTGRFAASSENLQRALSIHVAGGCRQAQAECYSSLARLAAARRRYETATTLVKTGLDLAAEVDDQRVELELLTISALIHFELRDCDESSRLAQQALNLARARNNPRSIGLIWGLIGALEASAGGVETSGAAFSAARMALGDTKSADAEALYLWEAITEVRFAKKMRAEGDTEEADRLVSKVRSQISRLCRPAPSDETYPWGGLAPVQRSLVLRSAVRIVGDALEPWDRQQIQAEVRDADGSALVASIDGRRFRHPGDDWVDLERLPVLSRLLARLIESRRAAPGEPVTLFDSSIDDVDDALSTLRALGLKALLLTRGDGYCLDPAVVFVCLRAD